MSIYDFQVKDNKGNLTDLKAFEGKVLLIVNTATECGFTPHYETLEKIYADTERDNYMSAQEAVEYGLIDKVL